jgi:NADH:ubiquinone oxidoreductase subunit E
MNSLKETFQQQGYLTRDQLKEYAENNRISYDLVKKVLSDLGIKIYDIKPKGEVKSTSGGYEKCVLCGKKTAVKVSEKIDRREHYVTGVGQLCKECHKKL